MPELTVTLPDLESDDPAVLAALYGPFGFIDHYRKVVLADVTEMLRAGFDTAGAKVTETRLDLMARRHGLYIDFLTRALRGRTTYHREVLKQEGYHA